MDLDLKIIPKGYYCYARKKDGTREVCPYWIHITDSKARCILLNKTDEKFGCTDLLWDQVKDIHCPGKKK